MAVNNEVNITLSAKDKASSKFKDIERSSWGLWSKLKWLWWPLAAFSLWLWAVSAAAWLVWTKMLDMGADLEQTIWKAKTVFGEYFWEMDKFAQANATAMWLTRAEYLKTAASMQDLLIPMWFTRKEATKMTQETTSLAWALAEWSAWQYNAAQVWDILTKAMLWEREQLKSLWISISEADVQQKLLQNWTDKLTWAALNQAKAIATQQLIFEKSTDAQAAYANGADKLTRKKNEMIATLWNLQTTIISSLIPAFWDIVTAIKPVITNIAENISLWFKNKENVDALIWTIQTIIWIFWVLFNIIWTIIWVLYQFWEWIWFVIFKITEFAWWVVEKMSSVKENIITTFQSIKENILWVFESIKSETINVFDWIINKITELWNKFWTWIEVIWAAITWLYLPKIIMMWAISIVEFAKISASWLAMQVQAIATSTVIAVQAIPWIIASIWNLVLSMWAAIIKTGISWVTLWTQALTSAATVWVWILKIVWSWVLMWVQSTIQAAKIAAAWFVSFWPIGWVTGAIVALWVLVVKNWDLISAKTQELWNAIMSVFSAIKETTFSVFEWMKNTIIEKFKWAIDFVTWALWKIKWIWENVSNTVWNIKKAAWDVWAWVWEFISWTKANWWNVKAWSAYRVWERGSELFVPSTNGTIIPNSWIGWNISINMWGVTVNNEADENRLVQKIQANLTETLQMYKFWIS